MKYSYLIPTLVLIALLGGCAAAPKIQYYTLIPPLADTALANAASKATAGRYAISVQPVSVPDQVDRPQIVISGGDSARVTPLNESLWVSPLGDQVRRALSADLSARLGTLDIAADTAPSSLPVWKIFLTVQRFDAIFGRQTILDATWRLDPVHLRGRRPTICRAEVTVPVGAGVPALVMGQRKALWTLSSLIAAQISGGPPAPSNRPGVVLKGCA
ncbi:MAG TPA: PqiC family protein [Burkholderiaceae bacterium]|nr:PqiC family protein [Burkholderiaceae bacterium]